MNRKNQQIKHDHIPLAIFIVIIPLLFVTNACEKGSDEKAKDAEMKTQEEYRIAFMSSRARHSDIYTMKVDGTLQERLTNSPVAALEPTWSPDATKVAFLSVATKATVNIVAEIIVAELKTGLIKRIKTPVRKIGFSLSYSPQGNKILYQSASNETGAIYVYDMTSDQSSVVLTNTSGPASWSPDGKSIAVLSDHKIYIVSISGEKLKVLPTEFIECRSPSWSPNGNLIAFSGEKDNNVDIWTINIDGSGLRRLTTDFAEDIDPSWSPDCRKIVFSSNRDDDWEIYVMNSDGTSQINLSNSEGLDLQPVWSPSPVSPQDTKTFYISRSTSILDESDRMNRRKVEFSPLKALPFARNRAYLWKEKAVLTKVVTLPLLAAARETDGTTYELIGGAYFTFVSAKKEIILRSDYDGIRVEWNESTVSDSSLLPLENWKIDIQEAISLAEEVGAFYVEKFSGSPNFLEMFDIQGKIAPVWGIGCYRIARGDKVLVDANLGKVYRITRKGEIVLVKN